MMSKKFFIISLIVIGFILNMFTFVTSSEEPINNNDWWIYTENKEYEIYNAPIFNYTKFWQIFKTKTYWDLEYYNTFLNKWQSIKQYLNINRNYIQENNVKLTFNFITPYDGDYRLTLAIDYKIKKYIHNENGSYNYTFTFEKNGINFNINFDFSDITRIPNIIITHGIKTINNDKYFWFRARKNNIPKDTYIELDPSYQVYSGVSSLGAISLTKLIRLSNGTFYCTFIENSDIHIAFSTDNGQTWTDKEIFSTHTCESGSLVVDSNDTVHLFYESYGIDDLDDLQPRYVNSTNWANIRNIHDEDKHHQFLTGAVDSNDNLYVVYEKGEEGVSNDDQVAFLKSIDNGDIWSNEVILTNELHNGDDFWYPIIRINSTDAIHLTFSCEDYILGVWDTILHMESTDYGVTWSDWDGDAIYALAKNLRFCPFVIDDNDILKGVLYDYANNDIYSVYNDSTGWKDKQLLYVNAVDPTISIQDNDTTYVIYNRHIDPVNSFIKMYTNFTGSNIWLDMGVIENGQGEYSHLNSICAQYPNISGVKTNRPLTGFCLVARSFKGGKENITFFADNLTWETPTNVAPEVSNPIPSNNSIDILPCITILGVYILDANGDCFNYTIEILNLTTTVNCVTNGRYTLTITYNLNNNQSYTWFVNVTDGNNTANYTYTFITDIVCLPTAGCGNCYTESESDNIFLSSALSLENETIGLLMLFLLWFWAEKKEDFVYFILASLLGMPLGLYLLYNTTNMFDTFLGLGVLLLAVYTSFLALVYSAKGREM